MSGPADTGAVPPVASRASAKSRPRTGVGSWLARPFASFHLVVTIAALLTVLGLVMVLSASSVQAYADGRSSYAPFRMQVLFAALGVVLFYLALRTPVRVLRRVSFPLFVVSLAALALVLVPGIGVEVDGGRRWFQLGPVKIEPSEIVKVTLTLWGANLLTARRKGLKELLIPLVPAGVLACLLIVLQPNLSTTIAVGVVIAALLWFGGLPVRLFVTIAGSGMAAAVLLALTAGYRSDRMKAFFNPGVDPQGVGYQARQAMYSLAHGGLWGRGLGQSRGKWGYVPNAHNDFIFAIIGEELGFIGCAVVIGLFALLAYTGIRIAIRSADPFMRVLSATATTWIVAQAFINIGYVIGLLPVTGLQLPLVSAGGSSLAVTLLMFGIVANAARHEPEAIAALEAGEDGRFSKLLRLPIPRPYVQPGRRAAVQEYRQRQSPPRARSGGRRTDEKELSRRLARHAELSTRGGGGASQRGRIR